MKDFIDFGLEYYKKSNVSYIKTGLDILKEIKHGTLRVGFSPKIQSEVSSLFDNKSDHYFSNVCISVSKKDLFSKKEYVKVYNLYLGTFNASVKTRLKLKKEDLILFSSANFVRVDNNQLPSYVPLIVILRRKGVERLNKMYDLVIAKVEDNKQKIYTLDDKEWAGNFDMIRSYKSVR